MPKVKIYSTSWCAFCRAEKQFLDEKGVKYEDVNVEDDQAAAEEMVKLSGQMGVPFTTIKHDDGRLVGQVGFDQHWLADQLQIAAH
jgi:glutaredoxin